MFFLTFLLKSSNLPPLVNFTIRINRYNYNVADLGNDEIDFPHNHWESSLQTFDSLVFFTLKNLPVLRTERININLFVLSSTKAYALKELAPFTNSIVGCSDFLGPVPPSLKIGREHDLLQSRGDLVCRHRME